MNHSIKLDYFRKTCQNDLFIEPIHFSFSTQWLCDFGLFFTQSYYHKTDESYEYSYTCMGLYILF